MKRRLFINPWGVAVLFGLLYGSLHFLVLLKLNPKGNNFNLQEWMFNLGASAISIGVLYSLHSLYIHFSKNRLTGSSYLLLLLVSMPVYWVIYLIYWAFIIRKLVYGHTTPFSLYPGQLFVATVISHFPIAVITITSLYNTQLYGIQMKLIKAENLVAESQLKNLQQQVDPHFLFNSLNILSALIKLDTDKSVVFTQKLSEVYRFFLKTQKEVLVSLQEDLQFVNDYFFLVTCRFGKAFRLEVHNNSSIICNDLYVIPGTLQLLAENVVKHNIANEEYPIVIKIEINDRVLTVLNHVSKKENTNSGYGLTNLVLRYQLLNKEKVNYFEKDAMFCVRIPLMKNIVSL